MPAKRMSAEIYDNPIFYLDTKYSQEAFVDQLFLIQLGQFFGPGTDSIVQANLEWLTWLNPDQKITWMKDENGSIYPCVE